MEQQTGGQILQHPAAEGRQTLWPAPGPCFLPLLSLQPWNFIQMDLTPPLSSQHIFPRLGYSCVRTGWRVGLGRRAASSRRAKVTRACCYVLESSLGMLLSEEQELTQLMLICAPRVCFSSSKCRRKEKIMGRMQFFSWVALTCDRNSVGATYGLHFRKILFFFQVFKPEMHCAFLQHSLPHHVCMQTLFLHTLYIGFAQHSPAQELALFFACEIPSLQPFLCRIFFKPRDHFNNGSLPVSL